MNNPLDKVYHLLEVFIGLPLEYKVATVIAALVALSALKTVWGVIEPVRFILSKTLDATSFVVYPKKKLRKTETPRPE